MKTRLVKNVQPSNSLQAKSNTGNSRRTAVLLSIVLIVTVAAYYPVLFDFFAGDDFVHLTWLKRAVHDAELVFRNFHSSWLDGTNTLFYRPLISVFMVSDYFVWGANGLGFHITNLLFHLISTTFVYLIAQELLASTREQHSRSDWMYPFAAAAIFGLYPLHVEAVSWITGRVDAVVAAFYSASLWLYIRWRKSPTKNNYWLIACLITNTLALLSKEMAITLPALYLAWELFFGSGRQSKHSNEDANRSSKSDRLQSRPAHSLPGILTAIVVPTSMFWCLLAAYFVLRRYALGTFVGGYDDSLFFISDWQNFIANWIHGLRMLFVPLNKTLMDAHHFITRSWQVFLGIVVSLTVVNLVRERRLARLFLFNLFFLVLALAPVYKLFGIADDLQGSRLAHIATLALSLLLSMCFIPTEGRAFAKAPFVSRAMDFLCCLQVRAAILTSYTVLMAAALWQNNQAWRRAGLEANAIRTGLDQLYSKLEGDPQVLFIGMPDEVNGAYVCRNALAGMTKTPQSQRDIRNCLMLNKYEQITPFGFLKESLRDNRERVNVYSWNSPAKRFRQLPIVAKSGYETRWQEVALQRVLKVESASRHRWLTDGSLEIEGDPGRFGKPELAVNLGQVSCFDTQFVGIDVEDIGSNQDLLVKEGGDLLYTNDVRTEFALPDRTHADFRQDRSKQTLVFPLRSFPEWSLGGRSHGLKLRLPRGCHLRISAIEIIDPPELMPILSFDNSGFFGTKGYINLSQTTDKIKLQAQFAGLKGATGAVLEIGRPNLLFQFQNDINESKIKLKQLPFTARGDLILERKELPAPGMYEARAWALDKDGRKIGVAGDHVVIWATN